MENYLDSTLAARDYARIIAQSTNNLRSTPNLKIISEMWKQNLEARGVAITEAVNEEDILPTKILGDIEVNLRENTVLSHFNFTFNAQSGTIWIDKSTDTALGHKRLAQKTEQTAVLSPRSFTPLAIYKLQALDHMTFLKGGALVDFIIRELTAHVSDVLVQAILFGGVKNEDGTDFTPVYPISGDELTKKISASTTFAGLIDGIAAVDGDSSNKIVVMSPATYAGLLQSGDTLALALMNGTANIGAQIVVSSKVPAAVDGKDKFLVINTANYFIGFAGSGIETLSAFEIRSNGQVIETRAYVGGTLMKANSAAEVTVTTAAEK